MFECGGVWLPDGETHLVEWMTKKNQVHNGTLTYQWDKLQMALLHCRSMRNAVDIGAHVGLWSMHLRREFQVVYAFEPVEAHRDCFHRNVPFGNVLLRPFALGDHDAMVRIVTAPSSSGDSWVEEVQDRTDGAVHMCRLDDMDLQDIDFIKLDCEGYELFALRGAEQTIRRCRPTICVEQKPGKAQRFGLGETDAVQWLENLGAVLRQTMSGDYILTFA